MQGQGLKGLELALESTDADFLKEKLEYAESRLEEQEAENSVDIHLRRLVFELRKRARDIEGAVNTEASVYGRDLYESAFSKYADNDFLGALVELGRYEFSGIAEGKNDGVFSLTHKVSVIEKAFSHVLSRNDICKEEAVDLIFMDRFVTEYLSMMGDEFDIDNVQSSLYTSMVAAIEQHTGQIISEFEEDAGLLFGYAKLAYQRDDNALSLLLMMAAVETDYAVSLNEEFQEAENALLTDIVSSFYGGLPMLPNRKSMVPLFYERSEEINSLDCYITNIHLPGKHVGGEINISSEVYNMFTGKIENLLHDYFDCTD